MTSRRVHASSWVALLALLGSACLLPARAEEVKITRADVAFALVRCERALESARLSGEELGRVNQGFDRATLAFFAGDRRGTLRQIDALTLQLLGLGEDPLARAAIRLRVRVMAPRSVVGVPACVRVTPLYRLDEAQAPRPCRLRWSTSPGSQGLEIDAGRAEAFEVLLDETPEPGERQLMLEVPGAGGVVPLEVGRWSVVERDLTEVRTELTGRLERLAPAADQALAAAAQCFRARLGLLNPAPDEEDTAQVFLAPSNHRRELEAELTALESGHDPYRGLSGEQWRAFEVGKQVVPYRVQVPPGALESGRSLPLIVAFHGFQGDENMFRWAYGQGRLFDLAAAEGWILCTPRTEPFMRDPAVFDRLLAELADDHRIDRRRVFLLGHSMGSQAVSLLAARRAEAIAGVVSFAGGAPAASPPGLSIRGALDPMGGFGRRTSQPNARVVEGYGHTLVVGPHLPDAFEFLRRVSPRRTYY